MYNRTVWFWRDKNYTLLGNPCTQNFSDYPFLSLFRYVHCCIYTLQLFLISQNNQLDKYLSSLSKKEARRTISSDLITRRLLPSLKERKKRRRRKSATSSHAACINYSRQVQVQIWYHNSLSYTIIPVFFGWVLYIMVYVYIIWEQI